MVESLTHSPYLEVLDRSVRCPPLLYALAVEPLAIIASPKLWLLQFGLFAETISLYADNMLLYLEDLGPSLSAVLLLIQHFGEFLGLKNQPGQVPNPAPGPWSPYSGAGFSSLGVLFPSLGLILNPSTPYWSPKHRYCSIFLLGLWEKSIQWKWFYYPKFSISYGMYQYTLLTTSYI